MIWDGQLAVVVGGILFALLRVVVDGLYLYSVESKEVGTNVLLDERCFSGRTKQQQQRSRGWFAGSQETVCWGTRVIAMPRLRRSKWAISVEGWIN